MVTKINIAFRIPDADRSDRYFSFRLQQNLENEPSVHGKSSKIFVVAGMENDFQAFCQLLKKQRIIDRYLKWQFQDGHLVILGNCHVNGEHISECLWLIYALEEKARRAGGRVHFILGNHAILNMNGPWRYLHPQYASGTLNSQVPSTALYDANHELWRWLRTKNIIEKIGNILFVSAGVSETLLSQGISINDINNFARLHYTHPHSGSNNLQLQLLLSGDQSPLLYRGYYEGSATEAQVDTTLTQFHVKTIVTGITTTEPIHSYYNRKVININPASIVGTSTGLLIKRGKFYLANNKGKKEKIIT